MELALFTPGAYIWPLHRNFEGFIAALGEPVVDCADVFESTHYPARHFTETGFTGMSQRTSQRLIDLHRDLYKALLRPTEFLAGEKRPLSELFWSDLVSTPVGDLLDAFYFKFAGTPVVGLSAVGALNVLRSAFFNHEAALPELWLHNTMNVLASMRQPRPEFSASWNVPGGAKLRDMAFVLVTTRNRSHLGAAWLDGYLKRGSDGILRAEVKGGLEPGLAEDTVLAVQVEKRLVHEAQTAIAQVFGWATSEEAVA